MLYTEILDHSTQGWVPILDKSTGRTKDERRWIIGKKGTVQELLGRCITASSLMGNPHDECNQRSSPVHVLRLMQV